MGQCTLCVKRHNCDLKRRCEEATGFPVIACKYYEEEAYGGSMGASGTHKKPY
jgi:hypothetical protein